MNEQNPYNAPQSRLLTVSLEIPPGYSEASLSIGRLRSAAWLSIFYFFLSLPSLWFAIFPSSVPNTVLRGFEILIVVLFAYLLLTLKAFLSTRFRPDGFDKFVYLIVGVTAVSAIPGIVWPNPTGDDLISGIAAIGFLPINGIVWLIFGVKLRRIGRGFPYLGGFAILNIILGAMLITVVLVPFALVLGFAWDILLALVFFAAAREVAAASGCRE